MRYTTTCVTYLGIGDGETLPITSNKLLRSIIGALIAACLIL